MNFFTKANVRVEPIFLEKISLCYLSQVEASPVPPVSALMVFVSRHFLSLLFPMEWNFPNYHPTLYQNICE